MPYSRTSAGYPASIRALLEEVAADNLPRQVTLNSAKQAYGQRSRLYAYLAAIKRDLRDKPAWLSDAAREDLAAFLQRAMTLEFVVNGPSIIIRPRDESPVANAFRNAKVMTPAGAPAADEVEASITSLLGKINVKS